MVNVIFDAFQQLILAAHFNLRITKLALVRRFNLAAKVLRHILHAIADTQYRHPEIKDTLWCSGRSVAGYRFRSTGRLKCAARINC